MYTILVNPDNTLYASKKERIIQRSKLFDNFCFLVAPYHNGYDMSGCTVLLEYIKPISKKYKSEILVLSEERYEEYLKYILPIDTEFTEESGSIELQLSFIYVDIDADGNEIQRVRKTAPTIKVEIVPISAWSDIIPDEALSAIDQRIIKTQAQIKELGCYAEFIAENKADNIKYDSKTNELQLLSGNKEIGDKVVLDTIDEDDLKDGIPVVDFSSKSDGVTDDPSDEENNVIEF